MDGMPPQAASPFVGAQQSRDRELCLCLTAWRSHCLTFIDDDKIMTLSLQTAINNLHVKCKVTAEK